MRSPGERSTLRSRVDGRRRAGRLGRRRGRLASGVLDPPLVCGAAPARSDHGRRSCGPASGRRRRGRYSGKATWTASCASCHGADARGTEKGKNLIRSLMVLHDRSGSEIGPFLKKGHPAGAPATTR